jgi:DNA-binding transcriptional ArsR family regulator
MRQTKLKAEENVSELKTKLREALLKEQQNQLQQSQVSIEVDKLKYDELIEAVLEIDLV